MKFRAVLATVVAMLFAAPGGASAASLQFSLTGSYVAAWEMPETPLPDLSVVGEGFAIERVAGSFPGSTAGDAYLDFFAAANRGGLSISDADGPLLLRTLTGDQLYTGDEIRPVMRRGTFALVDGSRRSYLLRVANLASAVPEPATWCLSLVGFAVVGGAIRSRSRRMNLLTV